jgi:hypothetical protein
VRRKKKKKWEGKVRYGKNVKVKKREERRGGERTL